MEFKYTHPQLHYNGKRFQVYTVEQTIGQKKVDKELVSHPGAVVILPFLDPETILLIENNRFAVQQTLLELPAGTLESGEPPRECAFRELEEETGYRASEMQSLLTFFPSPGYCNEILYAFKAEQLVQTGQRLDATEEIQVRPTKFADALTHIRDGTIRDAKTITTLLFYSSFQKTQ